MLEPNITPSDFNELTSSIEHDDWLNGVETTHDGELVSIDTPWVMGLENEPLNVSILLSTLYGRGFIEEVL